MDNENLIGIFDSGVGGFSVYKKIKTTTTANIIYYGDCLRAPYGNREESEIISFIKDDIRFLQDEGATHFVNACNSMSVSTTNMLLKECHVDKDRYTDMLRAFQTHAVFSEFDIVLVLATTATIRSGAYKKVLSDKGVKVFDYAFKDLAFAIENNAARADLLIMIEKGILYAHDVGATRVVYGCTHYPLIHELFCIVKEKVGWKGEFIDPAVYVAEEVKKWKITGERKFCPYSSKDTPAFIKHVVALL